MAEAAVEWHPPDEQDILVASIPNGASWYELRGLPLRVLSYSIEDWDSALNDTKAFQHVFKQAALFHCYKDSNGLHAERAW